MNIPPGADTRPIMTETMFQQICRIGAWTPSPNRRAGLTTWAPQEGVPAWIFNPLATEWPDGIGGVQRSTWDLGLGIGPGKWNSDGVYGVGIYATEADGARAIVNTFRQIPPAFSFKPIADWLDGDCQIPDAATRAALAQNIRSWGTSGFADLIANGWNPPSSPPPPAPTYTPDQLILVALFAGSEQKDATGTVLSLDQRLAYAQGRLQEIVSGSKPSLVELAGDALVMASAAATPLANVYGDMARAASQFAAAVQAAGSARVP